MTQDLGDGYLSGLPEDQRDELTRVNAPGLTALGEYLRCGSPRGTTWYGMNLMPCAHEALDRAEGADRGWVAADALARPAGSRRAWILTHWPLWNGSSRTGRAPTAARKKVTTDG